MLLEADVMTDELKDLRIPVMIRLADMPALQILAVKQRLESFRQPLTHRAKRTQQNKQHSHATHPI